LAKEVGQKKCPSSNTRKLTNTPNLSGGGGELGEQNTGGKRIGLSTQACSNSEGVNESKPSVAKGTTRRGEPRKSTGGRGCHPPSKGRKHACKNKGSPQVETPLQSAKSTNSTRLSCARGASRAPEWKQMPCRSQEENLTPSTPGADVYHQLPVGPKGFGEPHRWPATQALLMEPGYRPGEEGSQKNFKGVGKKSEAQVPPARDKK